MERTLLTIGAFTTTISEKYRKQIIACRETWVPICEENNVKVLFFGGYNKDPNVEVINLPGCQEDYNSATMKQYRMIWYLLNNHPSDYYLIVGSDNYVVVEKLLPFLKSLDLGKEYFIGGDGDYRDVSGRNTYFHSGGGGIILSYSVADKLCRFLRIEEEIHMVEPTFFTEWKKIVSAKPYPNLIPACDVSIAYYIQLYFPDMEVLEAKGFYGTDPYRDWANGLYSPGYPQVDWNDIIVTHYLDPGAMEHFHRYTMNNIVDDFSDWLLIVESESENVDEEKYKGANFDIFRKVGIKSHIYIPKMSFEDKIIYMGELADNDYIILINESIIPEIERDTPQFELLYPVS